MLNENKVMDAQNIMDNLCGSQTIKYVRKDKGLIERKETTEKIILAEDNRQVLFG